MEWPGILAVATEGPITLVAPPLLRVYQIIKYDEPFGLIDGQ